MKLDINDPDDKRLVIQGHVRIYLTSRGQTWDVTRRCIMADEQAGEVLTFDRIEVGQVSIAFGVPLTVYGIADREELENRTNPVLFGGVRERWSPYD